MLTPDFTKAFARDREKCVKKHWDIQALDSALEAVCASDETKLVPSYRDHALVGDLAGCRALHIGGQTSNWVLIGHHTLKREGPDLSGWHSAYGS
ncbi:MAG: type II toxin-antitoxin system YafQ family toxin [Bifidobacteriaceae bacterium]|jgi:addiction module RelE/StbE family toxin|nr:type II toxin-antitoxin system YafQ family toxin [Bifidobacteriaceae bacterium]